MHNFDSEHVDFWRWSWSWPQSGVNVGTIVFYLFHLRHTALVEQSDQDQRVARISDQWHLGQLNQQCQPNASQA